MFIRQFFCVLAAGWLVSGCDEAPTAPSEVVERTWRLVALQQGGQPEIVVDRPERYRLELREDGRASIASDCNSCGGTFALTGATIRFGPLACTRAFCGTTSLDTVFTAALDRADTFAVAEGELVLRGPDVTLRFRE